MRKALYIGAASLIVLTACEKAETAAADANAVTNEATVEANAAAAAPVALASINETTWEFVRDGKPQQSSVDANGNYITNSGSEHIDHGTAVMKDGKACFTSAMTKDGEICWTDPMLAEGQSGETVNQKGEKLAIKRTAYVPLTM